MMWGPAVTSRLKHSALAAADEMSANSQLRDRVVLLALSWGLGVATFPTCLGLFQVFVFRPLGLTCAVWGSQLYGLCAVGISGAAAAGVTAACANYVFVPKMDILLWAYKKPDGGLESAVVYGVGSALVFLFLGGRFKAVLPSSLLHPGAFARGSFAASFNYASVRTRKSLHLVGKKYGCHTCGKKWLVKDFVADHQPPIAVVREGLLTKRRWYHVLRPRIPEQRFYPQCATCSEAQRVHLSSAFRPGFKAPPRLRHIVTHPAALRFYHFSIPLPFVVPLLYELFRV